MRREVWHSRNAYASFCAADSVTANSQTKQSICSPSDSDAGQAASTLSDSFATTNLSLYLANIQGLLFNTRLPDGTYVDKTAVLELHLAELGFPSLVALTETFLDRSVEYTSLTGYTVVGRKDRGAPGGGMI